MHLAEQLFVYLYQLIAFRLASYAGVLAESIQSANACGQKKCMCFRTTSNSCPSNILTARTVTKSNPATYVRHMTTLVF